MANITEKMGLNYDLDGSEVDYFTKVDENWKKIDAFLPLCVLDQIDLADLPVTPSDGDIYVVDASLIYIRQAGAWDVFDLPCGIGFFDQASDNFYKYDGTNIFLDTGVNGVIDAANVGGEVEVYKDKVNGIINFKTLLAGPGISIDDTNPDVLEIESTVGGFAAGTRLAFIQATAPIGWTIDNTVNDRFIRISNTAGNTQAGSFGNFNHNHTHSHTHTLDDDAWAYISAEATNDEMPMRLTGNPGSWNSTRYADVNIVTNPGTADPQGSAVPLGGVTNGASTTSTSTASITHGSSQHAYINAIICTKD